MHRVAMDPVQYALFRDWLRDKAVQMEARERAGRGEASPGWQARRKALRALLEQEDGEFVRRLDAALAEMPPGIAYFHDWTRKRLEI